jgi:rhamnulose-1-phosphate aldolase/alcohol dehydrogenase
MSNNLPDRWNAAVAAPMSEAELLLYRSNLLGADLRITNFGGGNTSAKIRSRDPLSGAEVDVLWVKGSGGDLGSMKLDGFATLYMERLLQLPKLYRGLAHEDEMVALLPHCTFNLNPRAASIDTPLHAYVPHRHVDHMHPDAVIAVAACAASESATREAFGDRIGWLPWQRPGFDLGLKIGAMAAARPELEGVVLAGHGLFTWGEDSATCYRRTLAVIDRASAFIDRRSTSVPFGGTRSPALDASGRRRVARALMPVLRGRIGAEEAKIGHFVDSDEVLQFVDSHDLADLAALGTSCPDHFLRTKIRPLVLDRAAAAALASNGDDAIADAAALDPLLDAYRAGYAAYYARCRRPDSPAMRDPNPVVYLVPGAGMITFARDKATARVAGEYYVNAINVMRGAAAIDRYVGLPEQEAFDIEYWLLEEAKLKRMPKPRGLSGRSAFITGGAGGIGRATASELLADGACVTLADLDDGALESARAELAARFGADVVHAVRCDVTDETAVEEAFDQAVLRFGGLDIIVSNAGIASAAPIEETTLAIWRRNLDVLATGYFLVARTGYRVLKAQGLGGSIVFVGSKNALAASAGASAYSSAKAAEIHLARCLALEGAPLGIRVNVVNPDAVIRGSKIWSGTWRQERATSNRIDIGEVEEFYRKRSLLGRSVYPEDVAAAIHFLASDRAAKSTGNILNVDAGNAVAFTR